TDEIILTRFFNILAENNDKATYGKKHCIRAVELGAVELLLLSDRILRKSVGEERQQCINLMRKVKQANGKTSIFSDMHTSGEQLTKMGGYASILRYPLPDDDIEEEDDDSQSNTSDDDDEEEE
ncbi:MAG: putative protein PELOTA 1, partial [Streblomastix strix]